MKRVRAQVRASKALRRERRRYRRRATHLSPWLFRVSWTVVLVFFMATMGRANIDAALGVATLWATVLLLWRAGELQLLMFSPAHQIGFAFVPLSDAQIFAIQSRRWWRRTIFGFFDLIAIYMTLGSVSTLVPWKWVIVPAFPFVQMIVIVTMAWLLIVRCPRVQLQGLGLVLTLFTFIILVGLDSFTAFLRPHVEGLARISYWLIPAGWINSVFKLGLVGNDHILLLLLPLLGLLAFTVKENARRVQGMLEAFNTPNPDGAPDKDTAASRESAIVTPPPTLVSATAARTTRAASELRAWSSEAQWVSGWIEKWVNWCLSASDRSLARLVFVYPQGWSRRYRVASCLIALIVTWVFTGLYQWAAWPMIIMVLWAGACAIPWFHWNWWGFQSYGNTRRFPSHAVFPLSYMRVGSLMLKVSGLRTLLALPIIAALSVIVAWADKIPVAGSVLLGLRIAAVPLLVQPAIIAFRFTAGAAATGAAQLKSVMAALWFLGVFLIELLLSIAFVSSNELRSALVAGATLGGLSWLLFWTYGVLYNRCWFDLEILPNRQ